MAVVQNQPAAATLRDRAEDIDRAERKLSAPWVAAAREELGEQAFTSAWTAGRVLSLDVALAEAAGLLAAWSWSASGDPAQSRSVGA